jgi:hypothetical protein
MIISNTVSQVTPLENVLRGQMPKRNLLPHDLSYYCRQYATLAFLHMTRGAAHHEPDYPRTFLKSRGANTIM